MLKRLLFLFPILLIGCIKVPDGLSVVEDFELERYLGTWHEIARIENSFEKNFSSVTATYTLDEDGTVRVLNKGYDAEEGKWKDARGRAKFVGDPSRGELKVSFFGPFYSSYNIIALDRDDYSWAMVSGYKTSLFWILGREPEMDAELLATLVARAEELGFDMTELVINTPATQVAP
ncbi:MAG TPA: lipocalin [Prosthecochloris aestuarii]|jgi:apolipoprotein D and lipocalin family protein|uniref:Lipocalin n=1 Tax=Prosthecochloris aestuarii TaxID=1102 RepID=A0A831SR44_PROAE|nr:lipocalin family protein [Prosthecochloris sp.]HED30690.1 lipocalin [Prosthecochloris aestuarii]